MVSDWIIGMWTVIATIGIVTGFIMYMNSCAVAIEGNAATVFIVGLVMMIFSAMHYSGM